MTYLPTAEHEELRAVVRELADERIAPRAAEIDAKAEFPWDLKELLAQQDLLGTGFEEKHGGTDLDTIGQCIVAEEIARADATTSLITYLPEPGTPTHDALVLLASWAASSAGPPVPRPTDQPHA